MNRSIALDRLRAIAILLMILDHLLVLSDPTHPLRFTLTRFSMPLFFLISGHLLTRIKWPRLAIVGIIGALLPTIVPWIDNPNVLLFYAFFAPFIVLGRKRRWILYAGIIFALALYANNYGDVPGAYAPWALFGLMATGALINRDAFPMVRIPHVLTAVGRYPLSIYVGHILILEGLRRG